MSTFPQQKNSVTPSENPDIYWMQRALELARHAEQVDNEVPVGAVVVLNGKMIGEGWNRIITLHDPTAHAEIQALRAACAQVKNYRLPGATLYVTLEPCVMCAGAIIHARLAQLVFATPDPKTGAAGSMFDTLLSEQHNHRVLVRSGVCAADAAELLKMFFQRRRNRKSPEETSGTQPGNSV